MTPRFSNPHRCSFHTQSSSKPTVTISGTDDHALYTLIVTDPDAPDPANPTRGEYVHWIITNISKGDISTGKEILSYQ